MNITYPPLRVTNMAAVSPTLEQLSHDFTRALFYALIPAEVLYFSLWFKVRGAERTYAALTFCAIVLAWIAPVITPVACAPVKSLQYFGIAVLTMKSLDLFARRRSLPSPTSYPPPPPWRHALLLLTELRYESFTPNHIRVPKHAENFSERAQLGIHVAAFALLQALPQENPTVLAFEVLLSIYIIWTSLQMVLRYKSSPALFGPLYRIDSLQGFWSETWHNAFASPSTSLGYAPVRLLSLRAGLPLPVARSLGVLAAFGLMSIFHVVALSPLLSPAGLLRVGAFFLLNGVATVGEVMVWGRRRSWVRAALAWGFETAVATWTAEKCGIPRGFGGVRWADVCGMGLGVGEGVVKGGRWF